MQEDCQPDLDGNIDNRQLVKALQNRYIRFKSFY